MRKLTFILIFMAFFVWSCGGGGSEESKSGGKKVVIVKKNKVYVTGEKEAEEVLKAYSEKNKDVIKGYASGMFKNVIGDDFFDSSTVRYYLKFIDKWDGDIREVRYKTREVTFEKTYYASACYSGDPKSDKKLYTIALKSKDKKNWKIVMNGLASIKTDKFLKMSSTMPE